MSTTTKNCEECANHRCVVGNELACALDHKPRWFSPKGTLDQNYGWKRKCDDFREMQMIIGFVAAIDAARGDTK